jgi:8-oxo-dGTP pyrophosphatase MutT (NUDIX family)
MRRFLQYSAVGLGRIAFWVGWPLWHVLLQRGTRTRVLVMYNSQALAVRSYLGAGNWGMPGGGVKRGEDPAHAASRELVEETGIRLDAAAFVSFGLGTENHHGHTYTAAYFAVALPSKPLVSRQIVEISDVAWRPLDEVLATVTDHRVRRRLRQWAVR